MSITLRLQASEATNALAAARVVDPVGAGRLDASAIRSTGSCWLAASTTKYSTPMAFHRHRRPDRCST